MRRAQLKFGDHWVAEELADLREAWMIHADQILDDEIIVAAVYDALSKRHPKSGSRGRHGAPAEMVLRLLILKHVRNWSYQVLEREVRSNLIYRNFARIGGGKMPDAKTMGRWGLAVGPEVIRQVHERIVEIAQCQGVVEGRRMRVDTTVVETNVHYPTDSSLLGDGVRVLIRTMKKITKIAGITGTKLRDRSRSVKLRVLDIARAAPIEGEAEFAEAQASLWPVAQLNQPRGRTGQAVLGADRRGSEAGQHCQGAIEARWLAPPDRRDGAACQAGHETDQGSDLSRRYSLRGQAPKRV